MHAPAPAPLTRPLLVIVAILGSIALNGLAVALPLFGRDTGEISDGYPSRFTPAGYVFSIWSLIYLGLIAYAIWQALPEQRSDPVVRALDGPILLSSLANGLWLVFWHRLDIPLTLPLMLVLLGSLITVHTRLGIGRWPARSRGEAWCARVPFGLYLGWITVATVANVAILLLHLGWQGGPLSPEVWAAALVLVAGLLAWLMALRRGDAVYPLVIAWAAWGIAAKQADAASLALIARSVAGLAILASLWAMRGKLPATRMRAS